MTWAAECRKRIGEWEWGGEGREAEGGGVRQILWNPYGVPMEFLWSSYGTTRQQHASSRLGTG
jgi:hypothetical protein